MAVIKIKNIKSNLQAVINYGKNGDKTENGILVSSVNCSVETAYDEMALTKKFFHKEDAILGYHIIQSFKGNEVSPKLANQIGKELAEELWGDKYQVVICTHINKENVHNHMIVNSVSFIDGIKYHNSKAQIAFLKETSDRLCLNYGLSIVDTPKANKEREFRQKNIDYFSHTDKKMQRIIIDIDEAIKSAKKYSDFKLILKSKGYENIKDSGKYLSLKTPYYSRNVRINRAFGEKYSVECIKERIYGYLKEDLPPAQNYKNKYYKKIYTGPKINKFLLKTSSFYRLYVHYLYFFGILPAKNEYIELSPDYYKQKRKNNMIFEELNFLARHSFTSIAKITKYKENLENKLPELKGKRELLWRRHKSTDTNKKAKILKDINVLTEEIDKIQAQKNACNRIIIKYEEIKMDYKKERESKQKTQELILSEKKKKVRV
ncbi:MAG: relaxase/mobilization nuclease domain-containing protein [Clostridia bacterium]|nr:relaxase/mobilization nuclease domain-containing protein [Clostridia bacterium]